MHSSFKSTRIPPRWLHCPRKGDLIADTFIPFKTPLDARYNGEIPEECRFDVDMLFASLKGYRIKLGIIIDLTNTERFYDKDAVERNDCKYVKLACKGHGETPTPEYTNLFMELCEKFTRNDPLHVIGVHCTHGFNRSGFLISSYLIQKRGWSVDAAIATFAKKRPPGIYKQDYLDELCNRFPDFDVAPMAPALPDWCTESDDRDDDGNEIKSHELKDDSNGSAEPNRRREYPRGGGGLFMEGRIPGNITPVGQPKLKTLQSIVQDWCGWKKSGFPGAQPVSMTCRNLEFISKMPYKVSWKADGTRYMMLIQGAGKVYMIDRDNWIFHLPGLVFPKRKDPEGLNLHVADTLLDGEMIFDQVDGVDVPRYLIYDIIKFEGQDVGQTDFDRRLFCIDKEIIKPRSDKMLTGGIDRATQPFSVRIKPFYDLTIASTHTLLDGKFSKEVSHKTDGLIFQSKNWKYIGGRCLEMLKWKPAEMNSMDFKLNIVREQKPGGKDYYVSSFAMVSDFKNVEGSISIMLPETKGYLHVGGMDRPFSEIKYTWRMKSGRSWIRKEQDVTKDLQQYNGKIIECTYDATTKHWKFMRVRVDKSFPNSAETAKGVCESIERPVTKEILYEYIEKRIWRPPANSGSNSSQSRQQPQQSNGRTSSSSMNDSHDMMPPPPKVPRHS